MSVSGTQLSAGNTSQQAIVTDGRTLRGMRIAGWIEWQDGRERHWTGWTVKRRHVRPGAKLGAWYERFIYRGQEYKLEYFDGCFHPFVVRVGVPVPPWV